MTRKVLITDSLFIFDEHIAQLKAAGFEPVRLDKVRASEEELIEAVKDCEGYILGGVEEVTENVVRAGGGLRAICFTGADYRHFIPAHQFATERGIAITNCPGANAGAVSEFSLALALMMLRRIPALTTKGGKEFIIANEFCDTTFGIIGYGHIGKRLAMMARALGFKVIITTRTAAAQAAADGFKVVDLETLCKTSDIVSLHINKHSGIGMLTADHINSMKTGSVLVNTCDESATDIPALSARITKGEIYFAGDHVDVTVPEGCPVGQFVLTNASAAYNTHRANKIGSDWATQSLINLLSGKDDQYVVNPEYKKNMKAA